MAGGIPDGSWAAVQDVALLCAPHAALILSPLWGLFSPFYSSLNARWKVNNYCSNGSANSFVTYQSREVWAEEEGR